MRLCLSILSLAALVAAAAPASAEDNAPRETAKPLVAEHGERPTQMASAELKSPERPGQEQSQAPARKRFARVTTCRCGDGAPQ